MATKVRGGLPGQPTPLSRLSAPRRRKIEDDARRGRVEIGGMYYHQALAFHPGGGLLATAAGHNLALVHLDDGGRVELLPAHHDTLCSLAFDASGDRLVTAGWDGTLRAWHLPTRQSRFFRASKDRIHSIALSADGWTAYAVGHECVLAVVDLAGERPILRHPGHRLYCSAVGLSSDERRIISSDSAGDVRIWGPEGDCIALLGHHGDAGRTSVPYWPVSIRFRPGSHKALLACRGGTAVLLDADEPAVTRAFAGGHTGCMTDAVFIEGAGAVVTASEDKCISLWHVESDDGDALRLTLRPHASTVLQLALSRDEQTLATVSSDHTLQLWHVASLVAAMRA